MRKFLWPSQKSWTLHKSAQILQKIVQVEQFFCEILAKLDVGNHKKIQIKEWDRTSEKEWPVWELDRELKILDLFYLLPTLLGCRVFSPLERLWFCPFCLSFYFIFCFIWQFLFLITFIDQTLHCCLIGVAWFTLAKL